MKKIIYGFAATLIMAASLLSLNSCNSCSSSKEANNDDASGVISVEDFTLKDKTHMADSVSKKFMWYETDIHMTGTVDTLETPTFDFVTNVFETVNDSNSVIYFGKHSEGKSWFETVEGHWMEDVDMNKTTENLITFDQAFERLKQSDAVLPKCKVCVLREPLGPKKCNPQYVFGNETLGLVYVDAVTGDVRTTNPAFDKNDVHKSEMPDSLTEMLFK